MAHKNHSKNILKLKNNYIQAYKKSKKSKDYEPMREL